MSTLRRIAWGRLRAAPGRSLALVLALGVSLGVLGFALAAPWSVRAAGQQRLAGLPLIVGPPGGTTDLVLAAVSLRSEAPPALPARTVEELRHLGAGGDVQAAGLHLGHQAGGAPVVGAEAAGRAALGGALAQGRDAVLLGEAVVGAALARRRGLGPGDLLRTDLSTVHDVARTQSFGLTVTGVLAPTGGAVDGAVLVSLPTAWMLDGHLHGHATAADAEAAPDLAGAGDLLTWRRVTEDNRGSFHQHGELDELPVSLVLVWPEDDRAFDLVLGELALRDELVGVRPERVLGELVSVLFAVRRGLVVLGGLGALGVLALILALAGLLREARAEERRALVHMGATPADLRRLVLWELVALGLAALGVAAAVAAGGVVVLVAQLLPG
jgi:putative ABC transport system permease protein